MDKPATTIKCWEIIDTLRARIAELQAERASLRDFIDGQSTHMLKLESELAEARRDTERLVNERASLMKMLACWYFSSMRQGWESGHTEGEVIDQIVDHMANNINPKWPAGYDLEATCAAIDEAGGE